MRERPKDGFIVRMKIKDEHGNIVGETEAISFKGLLSIAHDEGLRSVRTRLVQIPSEENGKTAIAFSIVQTHRGVFTGIGDANPSNVNRRIVPHLVRMAETRATARALRLAVNIGEVALEELLDEPAAEVVVTPPEPQAARGERPAPPPPVIPSRDGRPARFRGRDERPTEAEPGDKRAMSEEQRKLLFRLAFDLGESRQTAGDRVLRALGVERFEWATRPMASRAIDGLRREIADKKARQGNGEASHGA